jgi:hypothetical protein
LCRAIICKIEPDTQVRRGVGGRGILNS